MNAQKLYTAMLITLLVIGAKPLHAQSVAVKTNVAGWAMAMPNIGVELVANERSSWTVSLYQSMAEGWLCDVQASAVQAGYRYWFSRQPLDQFFVGCTATCAQYKASVDADPRRGVAVPVGVQVGYAWPMGRRWNLEVSYGVGGTWLNEENQQTQTRREGVFFTPTELGINISYLLR